MNHQFHWTYEIELQLGAPISHKYVSQIMFCSMIYETRVFLNNRYHAQEYHVATSL